MWLVAQTVIETLTEHRMNDGRKEVFTEKVLWFGVRLLEHDRKDIALSIGCLKIRMNWIDCHKKLKREC